MMAVPLPPQMSLSCGFQRTHFRIKPFIGFFPNGNPQSFGWRMDHKAANVKYRIAASADFSRRWVRKRRCFGSLTQSTLEENQKKINEDPGASSPEELISLTTLDLKISSAQKEEASNSNFVAEFEEDNEVEAGLVAPSTLQSCFDNKFEENGLVYDVNESVIESKSAYKSEERVTQSTYNGSSLVVNPEPTDGSYSSLIGEAKRKEAEFVKLKREESARKKAIDTLADDNFKKGNIMFYYPEQVKPDQNIEIFLEKSFSSLRNEPDVVIRGAFNDWNEWKTFSMKLSKSHLKGDWWSCQMHVPKQAYRIDFVFYNGEDVYENNDNQNFSIYVEGGMDVSGFENFLLEVEHRKQEELLRQEAEKKRQEEEQKLIEAERVASEADRIRAVEEVSKQRRTMQDLMKNALSSVDNVWFIESLLRDEEGNDMVRLHYNRSSGSLSHVKDLWIHGGHNNWKGGLSFVSKLIKSKKDGDWWFVDVVVPDRALVLDWVFADGPPHQASVYENNNSQDFHAVIPGSIPEEQYWAEEVHRITRRLQRERRSREEAVRAKAEKTLRLKAETNEKTLKTYLLSEKHIFYTEPLHVRAGSTVTLFYNPANTVLNGKYEVWLKCSFNCWTHQKGSLPPQKMIPAENSSYLKANVEVPLDAYMMDFVFSERQDGGIHDNKHGKDYHVPVSGGAKEPAMHIVHIAVEMAPIAKVGGLADVVTSLSRAVQDMNHNVEIILPKYDCLDYNQVKDMEFHKSYFWGNTEIKVWLGKVEGLFVYFLEPQNGFFGVGCIYGRNNDAERFGFFCHAALEFLLQRGSHPDIVHCHDWSSAPVTWLLREQYMHSGLSKSRLVFTIHNLEYRSEFIGKAMYHADKATTVSPTYSQEVSGNSVISPHLHKFHGILNGIDPDIWDPYNDKFIPVHYTSENVIEGKRAAKAALQQRLGLKKADIPLVGIITRLTHQKGIYLIKHAIWRTLERGGQVVLLGSAPDQTIQDDFNNLANQLHNSHDSDRARLCLSYDEPLSHLIYASSDFILVPSIFEPCGLTQLVAMRYGSIPVVRKTGGLYDTVFDVSDDRERAQAQGLEPNGFNFYGADVEGVDYALNRAISAWYDSRDWFNSLCKSVMEQDWSWNRPALDYLELYRTAGK